MLEIEFKIIYLLSVLCTVDTYTQNIYFLLESVRITNSDIRKYMVLQTLKFYLQKKKMTATTINSKQNTNEIACG